MESEDLEKAALIDSIARKMQFIRTYKKYFNQEALNKKTVKELQTEDFLLEGLVRVHSDPMIVLTSKAIFKKKLDPRWEPFVNIMKAEAKKKRRFSERWLLRAMIKHACTSDLILQYVHTIFVVAQKGKTTMQGLDKFHELLWQFFNKAKLAYLLNRAPMEFNYSEKFNMKALLQHLSAHVRSVYNAEHGGEVQVDFLEIPTNKLLKMMREDIKRGSGEEREKIKIPKKVNRLFGNEEGFNKTSLYEYGKFFFKKFYGPEVK